MKKCCTTQTPCCPVYRALEALSKKWGLILLKTLEENPEEVRFTDLQKAIPGINSKMLSDRLSDLEEMKLVERKVGTKKPITVMYQITEKGKDLKGIFEVLKKWGEKWGC